MTFGVPGSTGNTPTPSTEYPAKVFFHTPTPEQFIANGYLAVRLQKRTSMAPSVTWEDIPENEIESVWFQPGKLNYYFVDPFAQAGDFYRPVVYDPTGVEPDIPQPGSPAIDTSYEVIMTIQELKDLYLWGQDPAFISDVGIYQPDYTFAHSIRYGIAKVERKLNIRLLPKRITETHDWIREGVGDFPQFWLDEFPVRSFEKLELRVPGSSTPFIYPDSWLRVDKRSGRVAIVPDTNIPAGVPSGSNMGSLARMRHLPDAFSMTYIAGVEMESDWTLPAELKEAVGKEGAFGPLNVGGDLVGGAGLAGTSLSMDGLSQSVTTTNSSTNAGFGARLIQYEKELRETYKTLLPHYKGIRFRVG